MVKTFLMQNVHSMRVSVTKSIKIREKYSYLSLSTALYEFMVVKAALYVFYSLFF